MPLHKGSTQQTATSKIPIPKRGRPQSKVTTQAAAKSKASRLEKVPQTDEEKMDVLRSKLENSMSAFIKARKELEEVLSAGGSSEQGRAVSEVSAELEGELQRHRDLTSKVTVHLKENWEPKKPGQDKAVPTNSYEFLKSIMG